MVADDDAMTTPIDTHCHAPGCPQLAVRWVDYTPPGSVPHIAVALCEMHGVDDAGEIVADPTL
ncbi:hypothetical protein SEA_BEEGEE_34 [Gordonia phage BeeGee]|nr:hypothetical protein SEA_BEEGEE_34 [Gordonia phage BeeGee]